MSHSLPPSLPYLLPLIDSLLDILPKPKAPPSDSPLLLKHSLTPLPESFLSTHFHTTSTLFSLSPHIKSHCHINCLPYGSLFSSYYIPHLKAHVTRHLASYVREIYGDFGGILNVSAIELGLIAPSHYATLEVLRMEAARVFVKQTHSEGFSSQDARICLFVEKQQMISSAIWESGTVSDGFQCDNVEAHPDDNLFAHLTEKISPLQAEFLCQRDCLGQTLIFHCVYHECILELALLLELGVPSIQVDFMDRTPLHIACAKGNLQMCKMLVNGCEEALQRRDVYGETPLDMAQRYGQKDVVHYLERLADSIVADEHVQRVEAKERFLEKEAASDNATKIASSQPVSTPEKPAQSPTSSPPHTSPLPPPKSPLVFISSNQHFHLNSLIEELQQKYGKIVYYKLIVDKAAQNTAAIVFQNVPRNLPSSLDNICIIHAPWELFEQFYQFFFVAQTESCAWADLDATSQQSIHSHAYEFIQDYGSLMFQRLVQVQMVVKVDLRQHVRSTVMLQCAASSLLREDICIADVRQLLHSAGQNPLGKLVCLMGCVGEYCRLIRCICLTLIEVPNMKATVTQILRIMRQIVRILRDVLSGSDEHVLLETILAQHVPLLLIQSKSIHNLLSKYTTGLNLKLDQYEEFGFRSILEGAVFGHIGVEEYLQHCANMQFSNPDQFVMGDLFGHEIESSATFSWHAVLKFALLDRILLPQIDRVGQELQLGCTSPDHPIDLSSLNKIFSNMLNVQLLKGQQCVELMKRFTGVV